MLTSICNATITPPRSKKSIINDKRRSFSFCPAGGGSIEEKSREVIEKERFCQNTGYTGEDWVEIGMRGRRGEEGGMEVVVGMEADIYPRQCVTGSAKSAMMNVLAGINPQCTPPLPSSSAVPPPPLLLLPCRFLPSPHHLSHPLTSLVLIHFRNTSLSPFLPAICSLFVTASPPPPSPCLSWLLFCHCAPLRAFLLASSYIERLYIEPRPDIVRFFTRTLAYIFSRYSISTESGNKIIWLD